MLRETVIDIAEKAVRESLPDAAVRRALEQIGPCRGKTVLVAVGKAGWQMAAAAADQLKGGFDKGYVITKYGHSLGEIPGIYIMEAGHPLVDAAGVEATQTVLDGVSSLRQEDRVLFLLSGGGSALFEKPLIPLEELQDISSQLLACGADIVEINTIRKRLSGVKGGRFAQACAPAKVYAVILSDVVGDRPDMIASGPAYPDLSTAEQALTVAEKYGLSLSEQAKELLRTELPDSLPNVETLITGGVRQLCESAAALCSDAGFESVILTDRLCCEAREAGSFLGSIAAAHAHDGKALAFIAGGETVVHLKGAGLGGRNQEIALAAAEQIAGIPNIAVLSIGSDGTDGPTDAAGGAVDGNTMEKLKKQGIRIYEVLEKNDAYHALEACGGLVKTGATGTNVNDVSIVLISPEESGIGERG